MNSTDPYLSYVLESGVKVIIYGGQDDFIVNTLAAQNMVAALNWSGISSYLSAPRNVWRVNGDIAGYVQTNTNLTFVMVVKSGHDTSHDQPIHIKNLVETFVNGTSWK